MRPRARRLVLTIGVSALIILLAALAFFPQREPVYRGKPLTAWAQQYGSNHWSGGRVLADEAEVAIRQIDTNKSIPFLVNLMRATDTPLKKKLRRFLPGKWHAQLHLIDDSGNVTRIGAHGIAALGTNASAAVLPLIDLAKTHPEPDGRYISVFALRCIGPAAEPAIPFYIQSLTNNECTIRNDAAVGLVLIPAQWHTTAPHLFRYLEQLKISSDPHRNWETMHAIQLLGQMGTNAQPAVPILLSLVNDSDFSVRDAITNSLPQIDPDAAAKAGIIRK